jgi:hypothetical protein
MKNVIKKILNETYEKQFLNKICNKLSTGNNRESITYMVDLKRELESINFSAEIKNKIERIFNDWYRDIKENDSDRPSIGGLKGATSDSQGDISNFYLSHIQDVLCPIYMEMD